MGTFYGYLYLMLNYPIERIQMSFILQGFDPPHQSPTRTIYVSNQFPEHSPFVRQKFPDNRIISSKVMSNGNW